jgi:hypothetical protein
MLVERELDDVSSREPFEQLRGLGPEAHRHRAHESGDRLVGEMRFCAGSVPRTIPCTVQLRAPAGTASRTAVAGAAGRPRSRADQ